MRKILLYLVSLLGMGIGAAQAQQAVQHVPQHLDAATGVQAATAAANTALTLTIPAIAGQYAYITSINIAICQGTGTAQANLAITSTNLGGWLFQQGGIAAADLCVYYPFVYPNSLKTTAAGTATTIVVAQPGTTDAAAAFVTYYYSN